MPEPEFEDASAEASTRQYEPGARVSQIARVLGEEPAQTVGRIQSEISGVVVEETTWLQPDAVATVLREVSPRRPIQELNALVLRSFELARDSGKQDWQVMKLAVLKNRLKDLTGGEFDETDYGAPNLPVLARWLPQMISLEPTSTHQEVRLVASLPVQVAPSPDLVGVQPIAGRVRRDIWRALMDYSSGTVYVWDELRHQARPAGADDQHGIVMPTLTREEFEEWRGTFLAGLGAEGRTAAVRDWASRGLPTGALPILLRRLWNNFVKARVVERARTFFAEAAIHEPLDLLEAAVRVPADSGQEVLRDSLARAVAAMTADELRAVLIPASALLRPPR